MKFSDFLIFFKNVQLVVKRAPSARESFTFWGHRPPKVGVLRILESFHLRDSKTEFSRHESAGFWYRRAEKDSAGKRWCSYWRDWWTPAEYLAEHWSSNEVQLTIPLVVQQGIASKANGEKLGWVTLEYLTMSTRRNVRGLLGAMMEYLTQHDSDICWISNIEQFRI